MRERFYRLAADALEDDPSVAMVFAEIGVAEMPRHPRLFNVGIREQLMIGVAAGLALEGMRPVAHSYTPFLVERPYEQIKLDLGHQDLGAVLVSTGASYDGVPLRPDPPGARGRRAARRASRLDDRDSRPCRRDGAGLPPRARRATAGCTSG